MSRVKSKTSGRHSSDGMTREEYIEKVKKSKDKSNDSLDEVASRKKKNNANNSSRRKSRKREEDYDVLDEDQLKKKIRKRKIAKIVLIIVSIIIFILLFLFMISIHTWKTLAKEMMQNTSSIVLDADGEAIGEIGSGRNRENISLDEMPDNLKNAYVAIEDQRFYSHCGVDVRRTVAATANYITSLGNASFGGSTITQQLVKNLTGNTDSSITRKVDEWTKAVALESMYSKDEILEAYLNIIYVGPNIYGVEMGAKYYFSKSASELSLAECAYLAGINNSPNSYNPFRDEDNSEKIETRTLAVLSKMLELGYITESEYNDAKSEVESGLNFEKGDIDTSSDSGIYSYHTDALISELIDDISTRKNITEAFAENYLEMAGLTIYSTQDSDIQDTMETEFSKSKYILESSSDSSATSQAAMVIIDQSTGYVVGCVGGLGEKTTNRGFNRATQAKRQTGSAIKPIAILAPGIEEKVFTASTVYTDEETTFDDGTDEGYSPTNYSKYLGDITVRRAVESSQNIPFVKMMEELTPKTAIKYLEKMGISTLTEEDDNLSLALGGLSEGMTPLETAAAYATIANDGVYIEPTFYTKIENSSGKTVLKSKQKTKKVFSKETAYIVKELLTQPVNGSNGTATYCSIDNIEVAAKTGTTNENYDRWLCGFTPYYTAACWYGYDINETISYNGQNPAGLIWSRVMKEVHSGLSSASFEKPDKVESYTVCSTSGMIATNSCTSTYTEYYLKGTAPDSCTTHKGSSSKSSSGSSSSSSSDSSTKKNTSADEDNSGETNVEEETTTEPEDNKSSPSGNNNQNQSTESTNKSDTVESGESSDQSGDVDIEPSTESTESDGSSDDVEDANYDDNGP